LAGLWGWTGRRRSNELCLGVGVALIGWVVVQLLFLQAFSLFQATSLAVGAYFIAKSGRVGLSPGVRGWLVVTVGALVLATGIGLIPQFVENLPSAGALLSIVGILGGATLAITGARGALRDRSPGLKIGGVTGVVLVVGITAWIVSPAVAATNVPPSTITRTPDDVGLEYEEVALETADGVELAAWYVPSTTSAAVVVMHGAGSTRSDVLDQAAVLHRNGFATLLVDARGHGDSDGAAMDFGWYGDLDVGAAVAYLATRDDVDPDRIGAVGFSMGGEEVIGAATNPLIAAVVAEGATARTASDKAWLSDVYGWRGWVQEQFEKVQFGVTDLLTDASSPTALRTAVDRASDTPFLLVTAGTVADEGHAARWMQTAAPDRVSIWTVEGAGHTDGLDTQPDEWERQIVEFLREHLGPS
jgi:fermentation-respiration switch protein FrsA (DUF1100 family)